MADSANITSDVVSGAAINSDTSDVIINTDVVEETVVTADVGATGPQGATGATGPKGDGAAVSITGNTSGTPALISTGTMYLAGGNNITLSQNGQSISVIGGAGGAGGGIALYDGVNSISSGTARLSNANGVSFGVNGQTITASHNGITSQSVQTQGMVSINGSTGAISLATASSLSSSSNGSTISIGLASNITTALQSAGAYLTTAALSNHSHGNPTLNLTNLSGTTASNSAGLTLSLSAGNYLTTAAASNHSHAFSASGGSSAFQTLSFANSNGITFSNSNGSVIASHNGLTTARASTDGIGLNTAQSNVTWTVNSSGLSLDARGYAGTNTAATNASVTLNSSGISISVAPGGGGADGFNILAAGTQTAGTNTSVKFADSNGISFGMSNSSQITASYTVPSTAGLLSAVNLSAGTTSNNLSAMTFSNSNGVSFGLNGSVVTGTVKTDYQSSNANYLTSQSNQAFSAQGGSSAFQTLVFTNSNGMSFSNTNGSIWGSYTVPTVTNSSWTVSDNATSATVGRLAFTQSNGLTMSLSTSNNGNHTVIGSYTVPTVTQYISATNTTFNGTNISGSITHNTNGLRLDVSVAAPGAGGGVAIAGSNTTFTSGTVVFTGSNALTVRSGAGSLIFDAPKFYAGTQVANTDSVSFSDANGISFGMAGGSNITASYLGPVASASNGSFRFTTVAFSNANNVTFGTSAGSIVTASVAAPGAAAENNNINLLGANTAGNTTASGSTIGWSGSNLTLSGTNGSQVVISAPATSNIVATGGLSISTNGSTVSIGVPINTISFLNIGKPLGVANTNSSPVVQNSIIFQPFYVPSPVIGSALKLPVLMTNSSSAASSGRVGITVDVGVYTRHSTNSAAVTLMYSTSHTMAASNSSNASRAFSVITGIGNSTSYNSLTGSSAGLNLSASIHGNRELLFAFATTLSQGEYWLATRASTSGAGTTGGILSLGQSYWQPMSNIRFGVTNTSTAEGAYRDMFYGGYSITSGALPSSVNRTQINQIQKLVPAYFYNGTA